MVGSGSSTARRGRIIAAIFFSSLAVAGSVPADALPAETSPIVCQVTLTGQRIGQSLNYHAATECNLPAEELGVGPLIAYRNGVEFTRRSQASCRLCAEIELRGSFLCPACLGEWSMSSIHSFRHAVWLNDVGGTGITVQSIDTEPGHSNCGSMDWPTVTGRTTTVQCSTFLYGT